MHTGTSRSNLSRPDACVVVGGKELVRLVEEAFGYFVLRARMFHGIVFGTRCSCIERFSFHLIVLNVPEKMNKLRNCSLKKAKRRTEDGKRFLFS